MLKIRFARLPRTYVWPMVAAGLCLCSVFAQVSMNFGHFTLLLEQKYGQQRKQVGLQWQRMLTQAERLPENQKVALVNQFFARNLRYRTDQELWGQEDYWATPLETLGRGLGDCEDYAIAKYVSLRLLGIEDDKLRLIYVKAIRPGGQSLAHMVLGYYANPNQAPVILDSLIPTILPAVKRTDLRPVFSFNSQGLWSSTSRKSVANPTARLSRWRHVLQQTRQEGVSW